MFNPGPGQVRARLDPMLADRTLRVVALFPAMHRYRLDDPLVAEVFDAAQAAGAAVFVHCGVLTVGVRARLGLPSPFDLRLGDPLAVAAVAARYPNVPVIIPHFGAGFFREALMAAAQCPTIHLDTSSSNGWIKYHPGLTLEAVFRQALDRRRARPPALRHRLVVLPARLAEAGPRGTGRGARCRERHARRADAHHGRQLRPPVSGGVTAARRG